MADRLARQRAALWHRLRRRRGRRAVTDVPLELIIIIIILAIVLPIILAAFSAYTRDEEVLSLDDLANRIANAAVEVFDDGVNTTILLTYSLPGANGLNFTIGAGLYPAGVTGGPNPNPLSNFIVFSIAGTGTSIVQANNGGSTVAFTGMTCGSGNSLSYEGVTLGTNQNTIALTKMGVGVTFCGHPITSTTGFVEVSVL